MRDPVHLVIEVAVGELADLSGSVLVDGLALPDHGHLVPAPRSEVSVQAELGRVELSACEPFVEGRVGIVENPAPRLVPFKLLGYTGPELLVVGDAGLVDFVIIVYGEKIPPVFGDYLLVKWKGPVDGHC